MHGPQWALLTVMLKIQARVLQGTSGASYQLLASNNLIYILMNMTNGPSVKVKKVVID